MFLFLHGVRPGSGYCIAPGSDRLDPQSPGFGALAGGIGVAMNYRVPGGGSGGDGTAATLETGSETLRFVIEWLSENIASRPGDPGTIVILANSEGATTTAAYLFNEDWQTESGPKPAGGDPGVGAFRLARARQIEQLVLDYEGERVPVALWTAQYYPMKSPPVSLISTTDDAASTRAARGPIISRATTMSRTS